MNLTPADPNQTGSATALAVAPDGSRLYVTVAIDQGTSNHGVVRVINTTTLQILGQDILIGPSPKAIALTPDGKSAVVANAAANNVSVIDTATRTVSLISVGQSPIAVAISSDGTRAYVLNQEGNSFSIIDLSRRAVVEVVAVNPSPTALALTPQGDQVYLANGARQISFFHPVGNSVTSRVASDLRCGESLMPATAFSPSRGSEF